MAARIDTPLDHLTLEELILVSNMLNYLLKTLSSDIGIAQAIFTSTTADKERVMHAAKWSVDEIYRAVGESFTELLDGKTGPT